MTTDVVVVLILDGSCGGFGKASLEPIARLESLANDWWALSFMRSPPLGTEHVFEPVEYL